MMISTKSKTDKSKGKKKGSKNTEMGIGLLFFCFKKRRDKNKWLAL